MTQINIFLNCKPIAQILYKDSTYNENNNWMRKRQAKVFKLLQQKSFS